MTIKLCVIMDPILSINPKKDTTFAMLLEAERREMEIHYLTADKIFMEDYRIYGLTMPIRVNDQPTHFVSFLNEMPQKIALNKFDIILMRKDPPFDKTYLIASYLLEIAQRAGCMIVNDPVGIRNANEKLLSLQFPAYCPKSCIAADISLIHQFLQENQKIVVKPIDSMGGNQVFLLSLHDPNVNSILQTLTKNGQETIVAQCYIPEIREGDKRILMIDGEPYPYALSRIPQANDFRGNLAVGGKAKGTTLTGRDKEICQAVGPLLQAEGLFFVGLDIIGDYLTEINVTSPTCVREIDAAFNVNVCKEMFDRLLTKIGT